MTLTSGVCFMPRLISITLYSDGREEGDDEEEGERNERDFDVVMDEEMYLQRTLAITENEYHREKVNVDSDQGIVKHKRYWRE